VTAQSPAWVDAATDIGKVENFDCWALFGNRAAENGGRGDGVESRMPLMIGTFITRVGEGRSDQFSIVGGLYSVPRCGKTTMRGSQCMLDTN